MGKASRDKGGRVEREIVSRHKEAGIHAERVPLSGAAGGGFSGDIVITYTVVGDNLLSIDKGLRAEVKARKNGAGFKQLEKWLGDNDLLFLRRDRQDPMVVLSWETYLELIR